MTRRCARRALVFGVLAIIAVPAGAGAEPQDWSIQAIADLEDIKAKIAAHTPAVADQANPAMQAWHEQGYQQAMDRARQVRTEADWRYLLGAFVNGYGDPHLRFQARNTSTTLRYPGFILRKAGEGAEVSWRAADLSAGPVIGSRLVSCDGKSLKDLLASQVFSHRLNPQILGDLRPATVNVLLDRGVFFAPPVSRCTFDDGREYTLAWREVTAGDADVREQISLAGFGPNAVAGFTQPAPEVVWIGLPSFAPSGDSSRAIDATREAFEERGEDLRQGRAIIVDLRGNTGGTSVQGDLLAEAIWGRPAIEAVKQQLATRAAPEAIDWRASDSNADYVRNGAFLLRLRYPERPIGRTWGDVIAPGLRSAVREGRPFFREGAANPGPVQEHSVPLSARRLRGASPFPATVYLLTNGTCASACLDFADIALNMPGVVHIGAETGADGLLMEVRSMELESDLGSLSLPIKVVRGRTRGNLEAYTPDIAYDGPWNDPDVRAWVLGLVEAAARPG